MDKEPTRYSNEHPLNTQTLQTIESGLREGLKLHSFRSGGGLRVVRLENKDHVLKGYGEHYCIEVALDHTAEDFKAGQKPYEEQYGDNGHTHYLTGSSSPNSALDLWVLKGHTFDAYVDGAEVVAELHGYARSEYPEGYADRATKGEVLQWEDRGYTYQLRQFRFPNGELSCQGSVLKSPPSDERGLDAWDYQAVKTGRAATLAEAIEKAFEAPSVEARNDE